MRKDWTIEEASAEGVDGVLLTCPACRLIVEVPLARRRPSRSYSAQRRTAALTEAQAKLAHGIESYAPQT